MKLVIQTLPKLDRKIEKPWPLHRVEANDSDTSFYQTSHHAMPVKIEEPRRWHPLRVWATLAAGGNPGGADTDAETRGVPSAQPPWAPSAPTELRHQDFDKRASTIFSRYRTGGPPIAPSPPQHLDTIDLPDTPFSLSSAASTVVSLTPPCPTPAAGLRGSTLVSEVSVATVPSELYSSMSTTCETERTASPIANRTSSLEPDRTETSLWIRWPQIRNQTKPR